MVTSAIVIVGVLLTLVLPIYPEGISPLIAAFLAITAIGGVMGLMRRAARHELMVLSPWLMVLLLGVLVGSLRQGEARQALEDSLPYLLFLLGLVAGRGAGKPRAILLTTLWVCVIDSAISLYLMPSFGVGMRSTYTYFKITAGLPLVGLYLSTLLRHTDPHGRNPSLFGRPLELAMVVIMLIGLFASVSRGMMLGYCIGLLLTAYVRRPSQMVLLSLFGAIGLLIYSSAFVEVGEKYLRFDSSSTINARFEEIESAWTTFLQYPLFGAGLGASFLVQGFHKAFVHNMAAYHLWKFGLVGSALLAIPLLVVARQLRAATRVSRAIAIGGAFSVIAYLVTCAAYKTYYLVWLYGVVAGATLSWLAAIRAKKRAEQLAAHATEHEAMVGPPVAKLPVADLPDRPSPDTPA